MNPQQGELCGRERKRISSKAWRDRARFGGMREVALRRDGYKCLHCGMTDMEHREKYNCSITVNHIDGRGWSAKVQNNKLENLETLCISCHIKKDIVRFDYRGERGPNVKLTNEQVLEIRRIYAAKEMTQPMICKKFGIVRATVCCIIARKTWKHI